MVAILRKGLYPQKKILDSAFLLLTQLLSLKLPLINFVIFHKTVKWYLDFQTSNCSDINGEVDFKFVYGEWRTTCSFLIYELYLLLTYSWAFEFKLPLGQNQKPKIIKHHHQQQKTNTKQETKKTLP